MPARPPFGVNSALAVPSFLTSTVLPSDRPRIANVNGSVGVVPLPRPLPNVNYNFQIMSAEGLQITADDQGLSGVVYGANLA